MALGYYLISTRPQKEDEVYGKISNDEKILEIYALFGEYDFIVKLEGKDHNEISRYVEEYIRKINGVKGTKALLCKK